MHVETFYLQIPSGTTATITYTGPGASGSLYSILGISARIISGGASIQDAAHSAGGTTSSSPDSGSAATSYACELWWGVFAQFRVNNAAVSGSWSNSFTDGQTVSATNGVFHMTLNTGYKIVNATGNVDAAKTGTTQDQFVILASSFV
jgi:hypothetical protein